MKPSHRGRTFLFAVVPASLVFLLLPHATLLAQTEETEGREFELMNENDTGFERSDLGNVAQTARMEYAEGSRQLSEARKLRGRIAETDDPAKRAKLEKKLEETYQGAVQAFTDAIGYAPKMSEAYAGLGETYRDWGQFQQALEVHAAAVRRFPDDLENFEGWAWALMELNMLGNATSAYSSFVDSNPDRAAILMKAMEDWLQRKQKDPGDLNPEDVQKLAVWIEAQRGGAG
jgi:tetratricopeptide (TPR) repeat protein